MNKHLGRIEELVDTAARVHHDIGVARDRGDDVAVDRHHVRLGRCLRDCQRVFRNIHDEAALQDLKKQPARAKFRPAGQGHE